jgi:hypothetical protein
MTAQSEKSICKKPRLTALHAGIVLTPPLDPICMNEQIYCKSDDHHYLFGELQTVLVEKIESCLPEGVKRVDHASLAVREDKHRYLNHLVSFCICVIISLTGPDMPVS